MHELNGEHQTYRRTLAMIEMQKKKTRGHETEVHRKKKKNLKASALEVGD